MNARWPIILSLFCMGFTPVYDKHDSFEQVTREIKNIEVQVQDKQFRRIEVSTPALTELQDGEVVIISTNGINGLLYRDNIDLFYLKFSCITVTR